MRARDTATRGARLLLVCALVLGLGPVGRAQPPVRAADDAGTESGTDADAESGTDAGAESETDAGAESGTDAAADGVPVSDGDAETDAETDTEAAADADANAGGEAAGADSVVDSVADDAEFEDEYGDQYADEYGDEDEDEDDLRLRYELERIEIRGNASTTDRVILARLALSRGQLFEPGDGVLDAARLRLQATGWFSIVKFRLERGSRRGAVVLIVEVEDQSTIVISSLTLGISEGLNRNEDSSLDVVPYIGATVTETNLFGTGFQLSLSGLYSTRAAGGQVAFEAPTLFPGSWALRLRGFFVDGREYFGRSPLVSAVCPEEDVDCAEEFAARSAVVFYRRGGLALGTAHDLGESARLRVDWEGQLIDVRSIPDAASEVRGSEIRPIDFAIQRGLSRVSTLRLAVGYDIRDDPALTRRGLLFRMDAVIGTVALGSEYDFIRLDLLLRGWVPLASRHTLRLSTYVGLVRGNAPFLYKIHISDLTDLIPGRMLDVQLDRRPAPNLFGTAIEALTLEELGARVDVQYEWEFFRRRGAIRALRLYVNAGVLSLIDLDDLPVIRGYSGASGFPVDLTMDLGLRADTKVGIFRLGFSSVLGFVQL